MLAVMLLFSACATQPRIRDRPISFSEWRRDATIDYISEHYGLERTDVSITPRVIVLHWTAIDDLDRTFDTFDREALGSARPDLGSSGQVNVSAHFLVDRDGTTYRLMPETWMARHVIGLNLAAIGVENVGGGGGVDNMTDHQIEANIRLVRRLVEKYPTIEYLIAHSEYREFEGHPLWLEKDPTYRTSKVDPGERMMSAVRREVAELGLKGVEDIRAELRTGSGGG
jgi:N-acetyl-anhydromuramyl-L-alanine amidase AmpD